MPTVIPVKFAYASRELWFNPLESGAAEGDHVICTTERGQEIGLATADAHEVTDEELAEMIGEAELKGVDYIASEEDLERANELAQKGEEALPLFRKLAKESELDMKPVAVEYLFGGEKVVCYFAAEDRVDFRQLVRDLSHELHERVDMRQIGVREEAALMGGFAHCGQELCCARFGSGFEPVSIRMAKEQDLPLNSAKISGACGRLMCCLRYEFEAYRDFKQRAPKKNAVIETPLGTAKIVEYNTPKEELVLRLENGKQVQVPLADMQTSEAAHKKSEELGCACRPDTVSRDVLERLASPEVRAALEELDRKNGLLPEEHFAEDDLFSEEETQPTRRRRNKGGNKGQGTESAQQAASAKPQARENAQEAAAQPTVTRRRRRHKTVEVSDEAAATLPGQGDMSKAKQSAPGEGRRTRRRRRPGDKGGAVAEASEQTSQRSAAKPQSAEKSQGAEATSSGAPRKRRRRHHRKEGSDSEA